MKIYLARHGESDPFGHDDVRALSREGIEDVTHVAQFLKTLNPSVAGIWHSQKFRARQTAEILSAAFQCNAALEERDALDPMGSIQAVMNEVEQRDEDLLLVGHMPFMGRLAAKLLIHDENREAVAFVPGTVLCLEKIYNDQWVMCWMLVPSLFNFKNDFS